jgi:Novel STAND NTPase 1
MLENPFTPSAIASDPADFFGRTAELETVKKSLRKGSVAIHGAIGIGKSSLLARARLEMEGFGTQHSSQSVIVVGHKDVKSVDEAARLVLEELVAIDETRRAFKFKIGSFFEYESAEVSRNFTQGRHLAALQRLLEKASLDAVLRERELLIIAIDEVDKCPVPLAQLIRAISTHVQHEGVNTLRFLLAGVSPFYDQLLAEDKGVARFIYNTISLEPFGAEDATDLLETKFAIVVDSAKDEEVRLAPDMVPRIVALSGGHPHLLQLLGSYVVENEDDDPDGTMDAKDLVNSLTRICYEARAQAYDATIHMLTVEHELENLRRLLFLTEFNDHQEYRGFPTRIPRRAAEEALDPDALKWFTDHDILTVVDPLYYGLVDEFLRIRLLLDAEQKESGKRELEREIIENTSVEEFKEAELRGFGSGPTTELEYGYRDEYPYADETGEDK